MPDSLQLNSLIQQLRLSGISDSLESRLRQAKDSELPYEELLSMLLLCASYSSPPLRQMRSPLYTNFFA